MLPLKDLVTNVRESAKISASNTYELWSVPSFSEGSPERVTGASIGSGKLSVQPQDVLISKINPRINRVWIVTENQEGLEQIASTEWLVARIKTSMPLSSTFLRWYGMSPKFRTMIKAGTQGVTGSHTRAKAPQVLQFPVPVPPLNEQERIVEILEEQLSRLDAALESVRVVREKAAQFRRSLLHAAFTGTLTGHNPADGELPEGWTTTNLGSHVTFLNGYAFKSDWYVESGVRLVRGQNIGHGRLDWSDPRSISAERASEFARFELQRGDLVLALDRPLISTGLKWAVVEEEDLPALLLQRVAKFNADQETFRSRFLQFWIQSPVFTTGINPGRSIGVPHISGGELAALRISIPPLDEQERIVEILEEQLSRLDAALAVADGIEKRSAALRRSLLHAAFTGRLTEQWRESVHV